ncbi:hypothetical protein [Streptomyces sp. NBC_00286]|uniref:hypothetical protein n=1 Tax=Streptomyces sp. NBC_00286 TaxID=2975701 RepID=UPI002E284D88|nr:hypothetical protein [Streptomyces sp. NBC_00286]
MTAQLLGGRGVGVAEDEIAVPVAVEVALRAGGAVGTAEFRADVPALLPTGPRA